MKKNHILIALICVVLVVVIAVAVMFTGNKKSGSDDVVKVGVIQLVAHDALDAATQGFVDKLNELMGEGKVEIDIQNAQNEIANCGTIVTKFVNDEVDLIMANATPALTAACAATGDIPVLGTSVTDYVAAGVLTDADNPGGNVSGTSDLAPVDAQIAMLQELCPEAKTVGIIYSSSEANSLFQADLAEKYLTEAGLSVNRYTISDSSEIQTVATKAVTEVDCIYIPTDNTMADNMGIVKNITLPEKMPVICGEENMCKNGGLATLSISYYDLGQVTGQMAYEVLVEGKSISEMPVRYAEAVTRKYNSDIAAELGITMPEDMVAIEMGE